MCSIASMFSRTGAIMPVRNSAEQKLPLCGDLFYFRTNTLLQFSGKLETGTVKVCMCVQHFHVSCSILAMKLDLGMPVGY